MRKFSIFILVSTLFIPAFSQYPASAGVPFLTIVPSPGSIGSGGISMISFTPTSMIFQPAHIGLLSASNFGGAEIFTKRTVKDLLGLNHIMTYEASSIYAGLPFLFQDDDLTISLAVGYSRIILESGEMTLWDGVDTNTKITFYPKETSNNLTIGGAFEYGILLTTGITIKKIRSELPGFNIPGGGMYYTAQPTAIDFGIGIKVPVHSYLFEHIDSTPLSPFMNISLAYALNNYGPEVSYADLSQADPLPRAGRLSWCADIGLTYTIASANSIELFHIAIARESEAALFKRRSNGSHYYLSNPLGKTNIYKSMIAGISYDGIVSRKGFAVSVLGTVTIQRGSFQYNPLEVNTTRGYTIRTDGLFSFLSHFESARIGIIGFLLKHVEVQYSSGTFANEHYWFGDSPFNSITFSVKR
jgi:hypothetical protein